MEGAHKQQRRVSVSDAIIVGDKVEAAKMRRRVQHGAAAAGRRGESIKVARALNGAINLKVLEKDADEAIKAGTGLVQASLEHLDEAERSWDKFVAESGMKVRGYPTVKQVLMYMSHMSRTRERACLAHLVASGAREGRRAWRRTGLRVGDSTVLSRPCS